MSSFPRVPPYTAPTIVREEHFYPRQDAEMLRRAMKGIGTDERAIITVLSERTNQQRLEIAEEYKRTYDKDLVKHLRSELSGDFKELVVAAMTPLPQFLAKELHDALAGPGASEEVLLEVLCTLNNDWLQDINAAYLSQYGKTLEEDLKSEGAEPGLERVLVALSRGSREESGHLDEAAVAKDARQLYDAGEGRFGVDDSVFTRLLVGRSLPHLRKVFIEHEKIAGKPFEETIRKEFSGNLERVMLCLVKSVRNPYDFFAERLHGAMAGLGTNERTLNRIVVTRAELDLDDVKQAFVLKYKKSLASFVEGDTSGDYKRMLLAMIR